MVVVKIHASKRARICCIPRGFEVYVNLTDVADGELLEGVMHAAGQLQEGIEPFATRFRVEFHDETDGRTRLEIRQWLPERPAAPSEQGWLESFTKLDAKLTSAQIAADRGGVVVWPS